MTTIYRPLLVALSLVGSVLAFGCIDSRTGENDIRAAEGTILNDRVDVQRTGFTPFSPEISTSSEAANPLGWADRAERRAAEEAFARGDTPDAIGGGPRLDEESDD
jgi:hypothetical protein